METIEYKYARKQIVFYVDMVSVPTYHKCPTCLGEGQLKRVDDTFVYCPTCKGEKELTNGGAIKEVVKETKISMITIYNSKDGIDVVYFIKGGSKAYSESQLFETAEDAEKSIEPNHVMGYTS